METNGELMADAFDWPLVTGVRFKMLDLRFRGELTISCTNRLTWAASMSKASLSNNRLIREFLREFEVPMLELST